jgi:hypothetical protein
MSKCINCGSETDNVGEVAIGSKGKESSTLRYQRKLSDLVAKDRQPKIIFGAQDWQVHAHDVAFVEEVLRVVLIGMVSSFKSEYNLIIGTTPKEPRQAANLYLLGLKEQSPASNNDVKVEVRLNDD